MQKATDKRELCWYPSTCWADRIRQKGQDGQPVKATAMSGFTVLKT